MKTLQEVADETSQRLLAKDFEEVLNNLPNFHKTEVAIWINVIAETYAYQFKPEPVEVFTRQDMEKMFVLGLLNRHDCSIDTLSEWLPTTQAKIDRIIKDLKP
jgi:hypothetical protein